MHAEAETKRPAYDVGQIFREHGQEYERSHLLSSAQRKALRAIAVCRTEYLGGHLEQCDHCGFEHPHYNSCRNVNCPKCQGIERRRWVKKRLEEMLPVPYFHLIFTIPNSLCGGQLVSDVDLYRLLFSASSKTLLHFFRTHFGVEPGIISVLHTWGQTMCRHPHVHFLVTGGGLSLDRQRWIFTSPDYLFDVKKLSREFRKRFLKELQKLAPCSSPDIVDGQDWVVYCQKPFAGPEKVIEYLSRYVYRTAISNRRIKSFSDGEVTFDYKDYRDEDAKGVPKHKDMCVSALTFIGLFLQHVLPSHFRRIRFYGFLAGRERSTKLERCRQLLAHLFEESTTTRDDELVSEERICPKCQIGHFLSIEELKPTRPPPIIFANERSYYDNAA